MASTGSLSPSLRAQLGRTPAIAVDAAWGAMEEAAEGIVSYMRSLAPKDTSQLQNSIGWTWGDAPAGSIVIDEIRSGKNVGSQYATLRLTIYVGAWYARFVEFGTAAGVRNDRAARTKSDIKKSSKRAAAGRIVARSHPGTPARPFFYPAWKTKKRMFRAKIRLAIRRALKEKLNA